MSKQSYTPDNANEGKTFTVCTKPLLRRYPAIYEVQSNGKIFWWTHGVNPASQIFDPPGECNCVEAGKNPIGGQPIMLCAPPVHPPNDLDYTGSDGNRRHFMGYSSALVPPAKYLLVSG